MKDIKKEIRDLENAKRRAYAIFLGIFFLGVALISALQLFPFSNFSTLLFAGLGVWLLFDKHIFDKRESKK